jgi:hypothetical protein
MDKKHTLQLQCQGCQNTISFSLLDLHKDTPLTCTECSKKYIFNDEHLKRQLTKFEALCRQILDSEEILSHTAVGVDVGDMHVKIPYKLLLTRLNSTLDLNVGGKAYSFSFRIEPLKNGS